MWNFFLNLSTLLRIPAKFKKNRLRLGFSSGSIVLYVVLLDWIGLGLIAPLIPSLFFHADTSIVSESTCALTRNLLFGFGSTLTSISEAVFAPLLGCYSDMYGRKRVLMLCLLCAISGYLIIACATYSNSIVLYFIARFILSVYSGSSGVYSACIADMSWFENKTKNFALYNMLSGLGFIIGPFLGGILSHYSMWLPFTVASFLMVCNLCLITIYFPNRVAENKNNSLRSLRKSLKEIFSAKTVSLAPIQIVSIVLFFVGFGWSLYAEFAPTSLIIVYQFTTENLGSITAYESFFYSVSCFFLLKCNRIKPEISLSLSMFFLSILVAILYVNNTMTMLWICLPFQQLFLAAYYVSSAAWTANVAEEDFQGTAFGLQAALQSIAFTFAPLFGALYLSENVHIPRLIGAASIFVGALIFAFYRVLCKTRAQSIF